MCAAKHDPRLFNLLETCIVTCLLPEITDFLNHQRQWKERSLLLQMKDGGTHFQGGAFGADQPLPSLHKPLSVPHQGPDLDDVTRHVVLQYPHGLETQNNMNNEGKRLNRNQHLACVCYCCHQASRVCQSKRSTNFKKQNLHTACTAKHINSKIQTAASWMWTQRSLPVRMGHSWRAAWWDL